ncbi:MAG: hypothetical protein CSA35_04345 [Dethiosulfovibrio peptidovorans]|nr:MAG: hypothetical protein CSA35_04345 [Dethiosulfovibrio peptidovorans]
MNGTKSLVESSLLTGLAVVLFLAARFLPMVGVVFSLLCPAPLVILGLRHSSRMAFVSLAVATAMVAFLAGPPSAISFAVGFGLLGLGLGFLASRLDRGVDIMLYGVGVSLLSKLFLMVILTQLTGVNPFDPDIEEIRSVVERMSEMLGRAGSGGARQQIETMLRVIPLMFPAMLVVASAMDCLLTYVVSRQVLQRIGAVRLPSLPPFEEWRFPKSLFWAFVLSVIMLFFEKSTQQASLFSQIGLNLRLIASLLFMIQGLAVLWAFMSSRDIAQGWRLGAAILVILVPFLSQIAVVLGVVDIWIDCRSKFQGRR